MSGLDTIPATAARELFVQCLKEQDVLGPALAAARRAGTTAFNQPWSPVHQATFFGDHTLLTAVLNAEAASSNSVRSQYAGQSSPSPLHVAAVSGWVDLVAPLVRRGDEPLARGPGGRTALDVACLQQWTKPELSQAFGAALATACLQKRSSEPGPNRKPQSNASMTHSNASEGGWRAGGWPEPAPMCDFQVLDAHKFSGFVEDYVALRRPLLLRGADKTHAHTRLKGLWSRSAIAANHPDVRLHPSTIPYPKAYGDAAGQKSAVTVAEYLVYLDELDQAQRARNASSVSRVPYDS